MSEKSSSGPKYTTPKGWSISTPNLFGAVVVGVVNLVVTNILIVPIEVALGGLFAGASALTDASFKVLAGALYGMSGGVVAFLVAIVGGILLSGQPVLLFFAPIGLARALTLAYWFQRTQDFSLRSFYIGTSISAVWQIFAYPILTQLFGLPPQLAIIAVITAALTIVVFGGILGRALFLAAIRVTGHRQAAVPR